MKILKYVVIALVFAFLASLIQAAELPHGARNLTRGTNERANWSGINGNTVGAEGGNVTQLNINTSKITSYWQGYYGNITGIITLDDAQANVFYSWGVDTSWSPTGELYAFNDSVTDFSDVSCLNWSTPSGPNATNIEAYFGMSATDTDGVNETFTKTNNITIGSVSLINCPSTNPFQNNASQKQYYNETLIWENSTNDVFGYGLVVNAGAEGFDGSPWDFQMLVGAESGAVTTYYFYTELA